jgi:hypothetical protein
MDQHLITIKPPKPKRGRLNGQAPIPWNNNGIVWFSAGAHHRGFMVGCRTSGPQPYTLGHNIELSKFFY